MPTIHRKYQLEVSFKVWLTFKMVRTVLILSIDLVTICLQTIPSAKKDVYDFTTRHRSRLGSIPLRQLFAANQIRNEAKENFSVIRYVLSLFFLQRIAKCSRDLINKICKWGWARVVSYKSNRLPDAIQFETLE